MTEMTETSLTVGAGAQARQIAVKYRPGAGTSTPMMWLGGFMSDMEGSKAMAVDELAAEIGCPCIRFDYSGHGASGGAFTDGTISRWLEEAVAVWTAHAGPPPVLIGSSMGGWIALLLAQHLTAETGVSPAALVLIAPASDMTRELMWDKFTEPQRAELMQEGALHIPSEYGDTPYVITRDLIEDGDHHLLHGENLSLGCPIQILQGAADPDVPWQHSIRLMECLGDSDIVLTMIKGGDHRLSRPADLALLQRTLKTILSQ